MDYVVDFKGMPWESPMKGIRLKALRYGSRLLRLVEYSKDLEAHWCEKGHVGYILEGRIEISFARGTFVFNAGDGVFIPAGGEHRHIARALSDTVTIVFVEDV